MSVNHCAPTTTVSIRWFVVADAPAVVNIDTHWDETRCRRFLARGHRIGMVAEYGNRVVGFMFYELDRGAMHIYGFAVHPKWRRRGIGTQMMDRLRCKLKPDRYRRITLAVRESNMTAHLWLRKIGFMAVKVLRGHFEFPDEDAYYFEWHLGGPMVAAARYSHMGKNRAAAYFAKGDGDGVNCET